MSLVCDVEADFYEWTEPVARKQHKCVECSAPILRGEKHFVGSGKWDGSFSVHRQHMLCMEACILIRDRMNGGECIPFGAMWEWHCEMKWQYDRKRPHPEWNRLRKMLADIKRRERATA